MIQKAAMICAYHAFDLEQAMLHDRGDNPLEYSDKKEDRGREIHIETFADGGVTVAIPNIYKKTSPREFLISGPIAGAVLITALWAAGFKSADFAKIVHYKPHPVLILIVAIPLGFLALREARARRNRGHPTILAISRELVVVDVPGLFGDRKFHVPRSSLCAVRLAYWPRSLNKSPRGVSLEIKGRRPVFVEFRSPKEALLIFNALKRSETETMKVPPNGPGAHGALRDSEKVPPVPSSAESSTR